MAAEADAGGGGYEQWKYSIYLVGFPASAEYSDIETKVALVTDMIQNLVPEARIFAPHSFRGYTALHLPDLFTEDYDGPVEDQEGQKLPSEGRGSAINDQNINPAPGEVNEREGPNGSDVDISDVDSLKNIAVKETEPPLKEDKDTIGDPVFVTGLAVHQSSPNWIEEEALNLLGTIQKNTPTERTAHRSKLLLAGYGFGGIVLKQAVIIANTDPNYYDVALNISNVVFLATPHRSSDRLTWEEILLNMIKATKTSYGSRLLYTLPRLVDTVSRLSHVFYSFAARYPTTNFIEGKGLGNSEPVVGKLGILDNNFEEVVTWAENDFNSLLFCAMDDLDKLESLRSWFAPAHLSNQSTSEHLNGVSQVVISDIYFEALQSLSPSRWILYETRTLDKPHDLSELREIYRSLLNGISWKQVFENGSIQVTGPAGYGKSSLVKLLSQDIRQRSSVIVIDNFLSSCERLRPTLYSVYVSFIHQIISQRPSLFLPVQNLVVEILRQETWTEDSIWILLATILEHSRAVNFLIVIYDFEDWPSEIRSWWSETLGPLVKSFGSSFTFLLSSYRPINDLTSVPPHELSLEMEYERYREDFVNVKTNDLLNRSFGSVNDPKGLRDNIKKEIRSTATSFQGSFTAINTYLVLLFQTFSLHSFDAIVDEIKSSPGTEEELYEREITALRMKSPRVVSWVSSAVSWILSSVRQLRIEELGAAVAVSLGALRFTELRSRVSTNMDWDLQHHLCHVVTIENRYARITSASMKEFLFREKTRHSLGIQDDSGLTELCLHYIRLVLEDTEPETWQKCLSQISWKYKSPAPQDSAFEFLHYACRFWPTHFLLIKEPESSLKDRVVEFLLAPGIGERWFQLYQLCISHSASLLIGDQEVRRPAIAVPEAGLTIPERASLVGDEAKIDFQGKAADPQQRAVRMASYIGLASIIPEILDSPLPAREFSMINVRRGFSQRSVAFLDSDFEYYLECAICNDDEKLVKELLDSDRARTTKCFPLHKAAQAGCLKTTQTLFNELENPAETNQDSRTPLHQAAIGGSTKIIRFLLGNDTSDTHPRRMDVPNMIDIKDCKSRTPLIIASRVGNIEAAKLLIESGADLAIRDDAGKTALHYAVFNCSESIQDFANKDLARTLNDDDCKSLHIAAISGNMQTVSTLISALRRFEYLESAINAKDSQGKTPLLYAAEYGYTEIVKIFLRNEASMEMNDEINQQAANIAAERGHLKTVKFFTSAVEHIEVKGLLQAASSAGQMLVVEYLLHNDLASLDSDQSLGLRPFMLAALEGHNEVVRTLLRHHVSVNIKDDSGQTALHHAAKNGRCRVVRTLLHHHANVNAPDEDGKTPLHRAAMAGRVRVIEILLRHHADVNAPDKDGKTSLHSAAMVGSVRVIELLLQHAADLEARSIKPAEQTALHLAVKSRESVKVLLKAGAKRDAIDKLGQSALHIATCEKCYQSVDLLRCPENIDARDYDGKTPLFYAIEKNDLEMVKALGTDLLDSEDRFHPALEWAVACSALDVLVFLLKISSESVNKPDSDGGTIIHTAAELESLEVLTALVEAKSKLDVNLPGELKRAPLHGAAMAGHVQNMRYLIKKGAEVDKADDEKQTPLHRAAMYGQVKAVAVLLEEKADINLQDSEQATPLYYAAYNGRVDVVERLLKENADIKLVADDGWSVLHIAADNIEITEMLIAHGADVNLRKDDMWTPLHVAINWREMAVAQLLVEKGANLDDGNDDGNTALQLAVRENAANLVQLMLKKGADLTRDGLSCLILAVSNDSVTTLDVLLDARRHSPSGKVWDLEDMAAAYWQAIELGYLEALKVLVKKEGQLLDELSNKGFTGLETCLYNRRDNCEEEGVAVCLLNLGADPFKRRQVDQQSAFELGIISRLKPKLGFMDACLKRIPEDLSTASWLGFKELRIATELQNLDLWLRLEPLREAFSAVIDHDGWTLDHFIHHSADRLSIQPRIIPPLKPTRSPTGLVIPPMSRLPVTETEAPMKIAPSRLQVSFAQHASPVHVQADFPFPPKDIGLVFYEIKILHIDHTVESELPPLIVTLGFCGEFCDLIEAHPGWNAWSVGYHGDDGAVYEESTPSGDTDGSTFGPGDTVGCGIDYNRGEYFFTLDKKLVVRCSSNIIYRKLYPTIGHEGRACEIKVNFGEDDFVWQGAGSINL